MHPNI